MKRFARAVLAAALVAAGVASEAAAAERLRPDTVPNPAAEQVAPNAIQVLNDFVTPARAYAADRAVVHYVVLGVSAPPLNDDDADGVPDYVERVGDAADTAIAYYERRGFAHILADTGGPDARPDIYVSRFAAGYFGVAFPAVDAEGGAFLAVSNSLDPSPAQSLGSLYGTVAHELFHLVQFSYFAPTVDPPLDGWVLEGTAAAMETRVYPDVEDIVSSLQLRRWFADSGRSLTTQTYGAQLLWRYLDERQPALLPAYLAALAKRPSARLSSTFQEVTHRPFAPVFDAFAGWAAGRYGERLEHLPQLGRARIASVPPLGIHFVRVPRSVHTVTVSFTRGRGEATLTYSVPSAVAGNPPAIHRVHARAAARELRFSIPAAGAVERATLAISNAGAGAVSYRASAA
jgi:hypothetical protein